MTSRIMGPQVFRPMCRQFGPGVHGPREPWHTTAEGGFPMSEGCASDNTPLQRGVGTALRDPLICPGVFGSSKAVEAAWKIRSSLHPRAKARG